MASRFTGLFAILCALAGCRADAAAPGGAPIQRTFDFSRSVAGWTIGQADYGPVTAPTDVIGEARPLPAPLTGSGLLLSGTNNSDDLLLYATTRMPDLAPGATYRVAATVAFATDVPTGCAGVGGSPGESVWVIVGAATTEPRTVFDGRDYRVNLQRGNQSAGGPQGGPLGTIANTVPNCGPRRWETKQLASPDAVPGTVTADPQGTAWLLVGMDSGFESLSRIYLQRVTVTLTPTVR